MKYYLFGDDFELIEVEKEDFNFTIDAYSTQFEIFKTPIYEMELYSCIFGDRILALGITKTLVSQVTLR